LSADNFCASLGKYLIVIKKSKGICNTSKTLDSIELKEVIYEIFSFGSKIDLEPIHPSLGL